MACLGAGREASFRPPDQARWAKLLSQFGSQGGARGHPLTLTLIWPPSREPPEVPIELGRTWTWKPRPGEEGYQRVPAHSSRTWHSASKAKVHLGPGQQQAQPPGSELLALRPSSGGKGKARWKHWLHPGPQQVHPQTLHLPKRSETLSQAASKPASTEHPAAWGEGNQVLH